MPFHDDVARDFLERSQYGSIYRLISIGAEKRFGHIGVGDRLCIKSLFDMAIDTRLARDPTFYTNREWGKPCAPADWLQLNRVARSVIEAYSAMQRQPLN